MVTSVTRDAIMTHDNSCTPVLQTSNCHFLRPSTPQSTLPLLIPWQWKVTRGLSMISTNPHGQSSLRVELCHSVDGLDHLQPKADRTVGVVPSGVRGRNSSEHCKCFPDTSKYFEIQNIFKAEKNCLSVIFASYYI